MKHTQLRSDNLMLGIPWALLLLVLAAGLRLWKLDTLSLWVDEGFTYFVAYKPLAELVTFAAREEPHPPLYYIFMHLWILVSGTSEYILRFPSAAAGVLAIAAILQLGRRIATPTASMLGALLLTLNPLHIWISQEARVYSILVAVIICSFTVLIWAWRSNKPAHWALYSLLLIVVIYNHYYGVLILVAHFVAALVLWWRGQTRLLGWLFAQAMAGLAFIPWAVVVVTHQKLQAGSAAIAGGPLRALIHLAQSFAAGENHQLPGSLGMVAGILLVVWSAIGVWQLKRRQASMSILGAWLGIPLLISLAALLTVGDLWRFGAPRYAVLLLPPMLLLASVGAMSCRWSAVRVPLSLFAIGFTAIATFHQSTNAVKEDFRGAAYFISEREGPNETIVLHAEHIYPAFAYYYQGDLEWRRAPFGPEVDAELAHLTGSHHWVWLVLSHDWVGDPDGLVERWFDFHGTKIDEKWLAGVHLFQYLMEERPNWSQPQFITPMEARFGEYFRITGHSLPDQVTSGGSLRLPLVWQSQSQAAVDCQSVLELLDSKGRTMSQTDRRPIALGYGTSRWQPGEYLTDLARLPVPVGTPPGEYEAGISVYCPPQQDKINPQGAGIRGQRVLLGRVRVVRPSGSVNIPVEWRRSAHDIHPDLRLLNARTDLTVIAGQTFPVNILWQLINPTILDIEPVLELVGPDGSVLARQQSGPVDGSYPTSQWIPGEIVRDRRDMLLPATVQSGSVLVRLRVGQDAYDIGSVNVQALERTFTLPEGIQIRGDAFGSVARLVGYQTSSRRLVANDILVVTLYWQSLQPTGENYTVFVHLLDSKGQVIAQEDLPPARGDRPTSGWTEAEIIRDEHHLKVPAVEGPLRLEVGIYLPATGQRLFLPDNESRILLDDTIEVAR
jgi:hypothetical protein